jgi:hypothetical protein
MPDLTDQTRVLTILNKSLGALPALQHLTAQVGDLVHTDDDG